MQITSFSIYRYKLPLQEPLRIKRRRLYRREGLLLRVASAEGSVGWGEASPLPGFSRERLQKATRQAFKLKRIITGREVADDWVSMEKGFDSELDDLGLVPSVRYGLEQAAWSLMADQQEIPMTHLMVGDPPHETVSVCGLLDGSREEVLEEARTLVEEEGYRALKLNVGQGAVAEDIDVVEALSDLLDPDVQVRLDANQAWTMEAATQFAEGIDGARIAYLEEPLEDPAGLPEFADAVGLPVALDESMRDLSLVTIEEHSYAQAVVLKPMVLGGFADMVFMGEKALELGMTPVISSAYESGVGMLGLVVLGACVGTGDVPLGMGTYKWIEDDVLRPRLKIENGRVDVQEAIKVKRTMNGHMLREV